MRRARPLLLILAAAVLAAPVASAQAPTPTPTPTPAPAPAEPTIALGTKAGGIEVGGLTIAQATQRLNEVAGPPLARNVSVHVAGRRFRLTSARLHLKFDAEVTAKRAYYAGRDNPQPVDVPLAVGYRRAVVQAFSATIARTVYLAPRDATVKITLRRILRRHSRTGRSLDAKALQASIEAVLINPAAPRKLRPARALLKPKVTSNDLPKRYGTILTIDRDNFKLRLFKRLKLVKTYGIAVGMAGLDTPAGLYHIQNKEVNPAWHVPNSSWAGSLAGQTIPGGAPNNPLKARWMGVANGVGIHGTAEDWSIGTRASHGCIRMHVSDVIALYDRVPIGTPVLIA
jgi:lipoprotein-anchoring transpeptidase ErfK/SrfK